MGQNKVVLVDTSSWVEALRSDGRTDIRNRVKTLLLNGRAAWCDMVSVELWNGARGDYEKKKLAQLENEILCLQTTDNVWQLARDLAKKCRGAGRTVPTADLIIASCALFHGVKVEHCDVHFDFILKVHAGERAG
ncbi:MAG: PIN domain-containing protein [Deltaproteobacteria bacterium]|nr:PIN domain-containing protein [Deltaproteobacteria bacterium]